MKTLIMAILVSQLTACGILGAIYDNADTCQRTELIKTGQYPSWCGGSGKTSTTVLTTRDYRTGNYQSTTTIRTR